MSFLVFLLIGLLAGWLASALMNGHGLSPLADVVLGVIGAFAGGYVFKLLGVASFGFWGSIVTAAFGAIIFLFIAGILSRSRHSPATRA